MFVIGLCQPKLILVLSERLRNSIYGSGPVLGPLLDVSIYGFVYNMILNCPIRGGLQNASV